jgi:ComF family protein
MMTRDVASDWALTLKNIFFPIFCKQCGQRLLTDENGYFCPTCWEMSPKVERPFCTVCGRPHPPQIGFGRTSNFICGRCLARKANQQSFRRIYGAAMYAGAVEEAIKLLKFHDRPRLARPLGAMMRGFAAQEMDDDAYDYLIPVPLHKVRLRERGYNQSELLARELLAYFTTARIDASLRRIRPTRVQSLLKGEAERRSNVVGAFAVTEGGRLRGKRVLLVDDVVTTSGTVSECARVLTQHGTATVDVFAAALALPQKDLPPLQTPPPLP